MNKNQKIADVLMVPAASGAIAGLVSPYVYGVNFSDAFGPGGFLAGFNVPLGIGLTVAGATLIGQLSKDYVLPMIPRNSKFAESEGRLLTPVLAGVANMGLLHFGTTGYGGLMLHGKNFALGGGSAIGGQYLNDTFIAPYLR